MNGCCGEPGCRRREPFRLYLGDFSGRAYLAVRSRHVRGDTFAAVARHDVTAAVREFIRRNPEWVRAQLESGG